MSPNPNTRQSPIPIDNGASVAYIDDFEGAVQTIPLGVNYGGWSNCSVPAYITGLDDPFPMADTNKMEYKAKLVWFNFPPGDVVVTDIWPLKQVPTGSEAVTVLNLWYRPGVRAPYNYSMNLDGKLFSHPQLAWSGIQRLIGSTATSLFDENINFIELWINLREVQATAKLNIDLGLISEAVIPDNTLHTEDGIDGGLSNTGILRPGEDLGLDGLSDDQERQTYADFVKKYPTHPEFTADPSGDDWVRPPTGSFSYNDYDGINGTENNAGSDVGRFPDTEDLNRNNVLDRANSYYEYELSLDTMSTAFRRYVAGGNGNWFQIRIPLNEYKRMVGTPSFGSVEAIRVWLNGAQDETILRIAEFNLIGNQWQELVKNDSTFRVSVVNIEDNPDYISPLPRLRDPSQPDQVILLNEQSLNLSITGLKDGQSRQAIKRFPTRPLDMFSYRAMRMFVHGDERLATRIHYVDTSNYDLEFFLRFGLDSLNYYEYRAPIRPGWDPNNVNILFSEITAIKLGRDSSTGLSARVPTSNGPPGSTYQVCGQPTLTNIGIIIVGVENPAKKGSINVTTDVWIDELRLTQVDNTPGWAYRVDTQLKLADLATVSFNLTQVDPNFHSLEDHFGSRLLTRNWALSANVSFERFLPQSWNGTSLGFSYSHTEQMQSPKYLPGTDILVTQAVQRTVDLQEQAGASASDAQKAGQALLLSSQTLNVTETYSLPNIRLLIPSSSWLVTETINRLTLGSSFTQTTSRSPVTETFDQWQWNAKLGYSLNFSDKNYISPMSWIGDFFLLRPWKDLRIYFTPRAFSVSATFTRGQTMEQSRDQDVAKPTVRNFAATRSMNFNWQFVDGGILNLGTDYALDVQSSLLNFELDQFGQQRSFSEILSQMLGKSRLIDFGDDLAYGQSINFNPRILVPAAYKLDRMFAISLHYSARYDWQNNLQAGDLGKNAANSGNFNATFDINLRNIGNEIWSSNPMQQQAGSKDTTSRGRPFSIWDNIDRITKYIFKIPFFDFDKLALTFTQSDKSQNSGVIGRPGFANVFGRVPFFQSSVPENGPSLMYQLGLASDPSGDVIMKAKHGFPFFDGFTTAGIRAPDGNLTDVYSQSNRLTMRTSRPLWEGANLEINWNLGWAYNVNRTIQSDSLGNPFVNNNVVSGDVDRSFLSFPSFAMFKFLNTSISQVEKLYVTARNDPNDTRTDDTKIADAFENGLEALPLGKKILGDLVPRPNWTIRWDGIEKLWLFSSFATRISLDHSYTSGFRMQWHTDPSGNRLTDSQEATYGFAPLIGVNVTFKQLAKGNFTTSVRYGLTTSYDLTPSNQNIVQSDHSEISVSADFTRQGFEIPFFGLALSNDIDISITYRVSKDTKRVFDLSVDPFVPDGTPLGGQSQTRIEPRIKYILSSRVTASVYYKYTKLAPDAGGSIVPGSTTNEGGLDIHVAIQP